MATELDLDKFVNKIIANAEGTYAHTDSAEIPTEAFGLTAAATKNFKKGENESDRDYAKRIIKDKYVKEVKAKLGKDAWDKMPESMKAVAVDVHYNAGLGGNPSFVKALKDGDYPAALKNTLDIVGFTKPDGTQYTSAGLAKRRASIYNVGAAELGIPLITDTLAVKKDGDKSQVSYFTGDGNDVLFSLDLNKPLSTDSSEGFKKPVDYGFTASESTPPPIADTPYPEVTDRYAMDVLAKPNTKNKEAVKSVQKLIGADVDGIWGPQSQAMFDLYNKQVYDNTVNPISDTPYREEQMPTNIATEPTGLENPFLSVKNWWNSL